MLTAEKNKAKKYEIQTARYINLKEEDLKYKKPPKLMKTRKKDGKNPPIIKASKKRQK